MKPADVGIAVLVAVTWGVGFIASRLALNEFSPELMTTLRFVIAALPCLFLRKPAVSWPFLVATSFSLFLVQFLAQAFAIAHGVPVGLIACMLCLGAITTSFAYWLWGRLLREYPAAQVVPFALLVPFVGSAAFSIVFGETFGPLRLAGMSTVTGGIAIMLFSKRPQALPNAAGA